MSASERDLKAEALAAHEKDKFRLGGGGMSAGDVLEVWSEKFQRWERLAEFDGWVTTDRKTMILATLNGNPNLVSDW
jgi:hypothetical protein